MTKLKVEMMIKSLLKVRFAPEIDKVAIKDVSDNQFQRPGIDCSGLRTLGRGENDFGMIYGTIQKYVTVKMKTFAPFLHVTVSYHYFDTTNCKLRMKIYIYNKGTYLGQTRPYLPTFTRMGE